MIQWIKLGACVLLVFAVGYKIYDQGYDSGSDAIQKKWDKQQRETNAVITQQTNEILKLKKDHAATVEGLTHDLAESEKHFALTINTVRQSFSSRLQQSESRANLYQRQAEGGPTECRDLASFAGKLDRTLTEGRSLVEELRGTLEQRDSQVNALGRLIQSQHEMLKEE